MLALNETATLYARTGVCGGRPMYAEKGVELRCRTEPDDGRSGGKDGMEASGEWRVFAESAAARPGDRLVTAAGVRLTVRGVKTVRGRSAVHHLELTAVREG